jgi:hypothetical protein
MQERVLEAKEYSLSLELAFKRARSGGVSRTIFGTKKKLMVRELDHGALA